MELERRFLTKQLRATGDGDKRKITGYAAVFNSLSENLGGFREMIMPGAFSDALGGDVRALLNHDPNLLLGRTVANTLVLSEDELGLRYEILPPDTSYARDLMISLDRGDLDQSSFGFRVIEDSWVRPTDEEPIPIRKLHKVELFDVSPVTFPAYPATSAGVRSKLESILSGATELQSNPETIGRKFRAMRRHLELLEKF